MELLLTVDQVANRLQLNPQTVRRHLQAGTLRGVKRGKLWRVPESALAENVRVEKAHPTLSPLQRAVEMIRERDEREGKVVPSSSSVEDLRIVREAQTP